jgi:hypothetical protein
MSDDRFEKDSTVFNRPEESEKTSNTWHGITLEDALRKTIELGEEDKLKELILFLPEASREKYRILWREEMAKRAVRK